MSTADEYRAELETIMERGHDVSSLMHLCERLIAEKASAEGRAVAWANSGAIAVLTDLGEGSVLLTRHKEDDQDMPLYTHPAGIGDIRRAAEALGYMLCRWESISVNFDEQNPLVLWPLELCLDPTHWLSGLTAPKEGV